MVARLRLGNMLDKRRGEFTKTAARQAFSNSWMRARTRNVVKSIFTLARHTPDRRL
jgi:hypothetical protein